ncbi:MAG: hypothetical protein D3923_09140 [Candidatus Electrothrix sp. AR3]|nr:hypothetical protein [Candidatus Electrothrix sp. AR3]
MKILADTHLHLYPCFDLDHIFSGLLNQFGSKDLQIPRVACLAERADCNFYHRLQAGEPLLHNFRVEVESIRNLLLLEKNSNRQLTLLPGRQIITAEKIEVLALCTTATFTENVPVAEVIRSILEQNGIPVLPWSPGKWFFQRGQVIEDLLHQYTPQDFLIGDVSLRPQGWLTPLLMRKALRRGYKVVSGSDPLPFSSEEKSAGMYGSKIISSAEGLTPDNMLHSLLNGRAESTSFGQRSNPLELFRRLRCNAEVRKQAMV